MENNDWIKAYQITLGNIKSYKLRLNELQTWGKPFSNPQNDVYGMWREWNLKIEALEYLINENNNTNPG